MSISVDLLSIAVYLLSIAVNLLSIFFVDFLSDLVGLLSISVELLSISVVLLSISVELLLISVQFHPVDNGQYSGQKFLFMPQLGNLVKAYFCPVFAAFVNYVFSLQVKIAIKKQGNIAHRANCFEM